MNSMDKKATILLSGLLIAALLSVGVTFYRIVILNDFVVLGQEEGTLDEEAVLNDEPQLDSSETIDPQQEPPVETDSVPMPLQ